MNANNSKISLFAKSRHSHGVKKFWVLMFLCAQYNLSAKLFRHCANFNHFYSSSPFLSGSIFVSAIKEGVFLGALQIPSQSSRQILSSDFESTLISFMQKQFGQSRFMWLCHQLELVAKSRKSWTSLFAMCYEGEHCTSKKKHNRSIVRLFNQPDPSHQFFPSWDSLWLLSQQNH